MQGAKRMAARQKACGKRKQKGAEGALGAHRLAQLHEHLYEVASSNQGVVACSPKGLHGIHQTLLNHKTAPLSVAAKGDSQRAECNAEMDI